VRKFGLIGYPLTHSFSQKYFTEKFQREGVSDAVYENFPIPSVDALPDVLRDPVLCGLNVTIPYKQEVMAFLHSADPVVAQIGACNCIRISGGRLYGYNTDVVGFEQSVIRKLQPWHTQALILGTGGAAKAVEYVMKKLGIDYRYVSRKAGGGAMSADGDKSGAGLRATDLGYEQVDAALLDQYTLIINTTPLGMSPKVDECPPLPYAALTSRHYLYDLVYNPARTLFLRKGEERGAVVENGHEMLIIQAEESWRIWNAQG
jgi:shikimate dehydrogenase